MAMSDPVRILLAHDRWATAQMLEACKPLTDEQFHRTFAMGTGSVHNTLLHIMGAMGSWSTVLAGNRNPPTRLDQDGKRRKLSELVALADATYDLFADLALKHPVDQTVYREHGGKTYTFTRGAVVTHVATHSMHHRAQCLNMLRQLGVTPLPKSSVAEWTFATGGN
jgi:uncharacterized damage-inducible protein DinB